MEIIPLFKDERELIRKSISPKLRKYHHVRVGVRLKRLHSKLRTEDALSTNELELNHPLSPDIDILYWKKDYSGEPILHAVEVKYFRLNKKQLITPSFYDGIGEAFMLCTYGVDYVHLWHFFDSEITLNIFNKYKNILEDSLGKINTINYKCELLEELKTKKQDTSEYLISISNILKEMEYARYLKRNSLMYNEQAKIVRAIIRKAYRIIRK